MITVESLIAAGIGPVEAQKFAATLSNACDRFDISTPQRLAAFIGQCAVESARFVNLEENLYYSSPARICLIFHSHVPTAEDAEALTRNPQALANRVYADRLGNGDEASGDGWAYRGRGLIQLTGRDHYTDAASELAQPYVDQPNLVSTPEHACLTAAWYWHCNKLNLLADAGQIDAITRAVNGPGMVASDLRQQMTANALRAFA